MPCGISSRREFMKTSAAAMTMATTLPIPRSAHAAGSDVIRIGLIGCGNRGRGAVLNALNTGKDLRLTAIADLFDFQINPTLKQLKKENPDQVDVSPENCFIGFARQHPGQSRAGSFGLAALQLGQHAFANRRGLQLSSAIEAYVRRAGANVVSIAGDSLCLVRADSAASSAFGRDARRRKRLAGRRQNALALVFHDARFDILYDRPVARFSRLAEVFHRRIRGHVGDRLLGILQRGRVRAAANVPGASAARTGTHGKIQVAERALAGVLEKAAPLDWRRHPAVATEGRAFRRHLRLAPRPAYGPLAAVCRHALGRQARQAFTQTPASSSKRSVYVLGPTECTLRKQCRRASNPPGRDYSQKQLRQPKPTRRRLPSRTDERLSYPKATWPRSNPNNYQYRGHLLDHRQTTTTT